MSDEKDYTAYSPAVLGIQALVTMLEIRKDALAGALEQGFGDLSLNIGYGMALEDAGRMLETMKAEERRHQKLDRERSVQQAQEGLRDSFPGPRGAEKSEPYIGAKTYEGTFERAATGNLHTVRVKAVQWDGTEEHFEQLKNWVVAIRPIQEPDYHPELSSYLGTRGVSFTLGMGDHFGNFFVAEKGDYLYLTDGQFRTSQSSTFKSQYKEVK